MADEQVAQFISVLQFIQQLQDLSLDRYVQSRDRLVRNDELRPCDHGRGDADSLALSSGQLPGPSLKVLVIQTDGVKGLPDRFASLLSRTRDPVIRLFWCPAFSHSRVRSLLQSSQRLLQDPSDRPCRIEAGERILEHHLRESCVMDHLSVVVFHDPQDDLRKGRLAAAALAHQPENVPLPDLKAHVTQHLLPVVVAEIRQVLFIKAVQMPDFQNQVTHLHLTSYHATGSLRSGVLYRNAPDARRRLLSFRSPRSFPSASRSRGCRAGGPLSDHG